MKQILSIFFLTFAIVGCSTPNEFIVSNNIDEIKTLLNSDCVFTSNKCNFSIITDKDELLNIVKFLNVRKAKWKYASTTYPSPLFSSDAKLKNKNIFSINIGVNWIGLSIEGKQVLQGISKEDHSSLKMMLKTI